MCSVLAYCISPSFAATIREAGLSHDVLYSDDWFCEARHRFSIQALGDGRAKRVDTRHERSVHVVSKPPAIPLRGATEEEAWRTGTLCVIHSDESTLRIACKQRLDVPFEKFGGRCQSIAAICVRSARTSRAGRR